MEAPPRSPAARRLLVAAFALSTVYFTGFFPPGDNPNELSRIQAIVAFVEQGTFSIDETIRRFGNQDDKSVFEGRYYSNKAPGLIFAGIPLYAALRAVFPPPQRGTDAIFVLVRVLTVSLASVLALARFARRLERTEGGKGAALLVAFAVVFGTPFLYYSRSFFSHAWTAALLFLSWDAIRAAEARSGGRAGVRLLLAGLLAGWATISEYPAAVIGLFLAWRAAAGRGVRGILLFGAGAAPAFALLAAYDSICFGSPFSLSSAHEASPTYSQLAQRGVFGVRLPDPGRAIRILIHPARGLILFSPFLAWAVPGAIRWWRSRRERADCVLAVGSSLATFLVIGAYPNWEGGWSLGVRYFLPALFFAGATLPHALTTPRSRGLFVAATAFAAGNAFLLTSAYPHVPLAMWWPAATLSWFLIRGGAVAPNLGLAAGFPPVLSLLLPLACAAALFALVARAVPRSGLAAAGGLALLLLTLAVPPKLPDWDRTWRQDLRRHLLEAAGRGSPRSAPL